MAFSNASRVIMSRGLMSFSSRSYMTAPESKATWSLRGSMAGMDAAPGMDIPMASIAEDMVLAVNIPAQAPSPGQATRSMPMSSSRVILPCEYAPMASYIS